MADRYEIAWRLEPDPTRRSLAAGFAAGVHDPVWFLSRQWQMGEHQGENATTPVLVPTRRCRRRCRPRRTTPPGDPTVVPAEALVEAEVDSWWTLGRRVRIVRPGARARPVHHGPVVPAGRSRRRRTSGWPAGSTGWRYGGARTARPLGGGLRAVRRPRRAAVPVGAGGAGVLGVVPGGGGGDDPGAAAAPRRPGGLVLRVRRPHPLGRRRRPGGHTRPRCSILARRTAAGGRSRTPPSTSAATRRTAATSPPRC